MIEPAPRAPVPWRVTDLVVLYFTTGLGFALVVIAYWGASGTAVVRDQVPWINLGVVGVMTIGIGNVIWLLTGRRAVGERRSATLTGVGVPSATDVSGAAWDSAAGGVSQPVASQGMQRYHRPDCQLVVGKDVVAATVVRHQADGRRPCGMCCP